MLKVLVFLAEMVGAVFFFGSIFLLFGVVIPAYSAGGF